MDPDALLDTLFDVGPFWLMMLLSALLAGHMIAHHVGRKPDRFRDMTLWRTSLSGIYCTLCVCISFGFVSLVWGLVMVAVGSSE